MKHRPRAGNRKYGGANNNLLSRDEWVQAVACLQQPPVIGIEPGRAELKGRPTRQPRRMRSQGPSPTRLCLVAEPTPRAGCPQERLGDRPY